MAVAFLLERVQALGPVVAPLQLLEPGLLLGQVPAEVRRRLFAQLAFLSSSPEASSTICVRRSGPPRAPRLILSGNRTS